MIEINDNHYYLGMWFFEIPHHFSRHGLGGDFLMCISRKLDEPTKWKVVYRFRYAKDGKIWDSDDDKTWYEGMLVDRSEAEVESSIRQVIKTLAVVADKPPHFFEVRGNGAVFEQRATTNPPPWMHAKQISEEEFKKMKGCDLTKCEVSSTTSSKAAT